MIRRLKCKPNGKGLEFCRKKFVETSFFKSIKFVETPFNIITPDCLEGQNPDFKIRRICGTPFLYYHHTRILLTMHPGTHKMKEICGNLFLWCIKLSIFLNNGKKNFMVRAWNSAERNLWKPLSLKVSNYLSF